VISHPDFVDRTQEEVLEEELEEEIIADFEEEEDLALLRKEKKELKFWEQPPFSSLLDLELAKESDIVFYDLANLIEKFFGKMLKEDLINYKISGIALKSAASLHHYKISSIIKQEEEIQKKEELERIRARHSRTIPKTLPQPIQPKLQIATKEELFDAMRAAIIETMQNKEKLRRRRIRRDEVKQKRIQMKSKAKLPKELLKHISGKDQTVEELHDSWFNRIKATIDLNSKDTSLFDLLNLIKNDEKSSIGRRFALVKMFLALMFLSTNKRLTLSQTDDFKDISIGMKT
jgi:chromatin segregation and condensation protein Rec8/ScpA/Scc1 (kleisin family)